MEREISETFLLLKSDLMIPLTPPPAGSGILQCHPNPLSRGLCVPCPTLLEHLLLPSLDLTGGSGWHPVGRKPALALQAEWERAAMLRGKLTAWQELRNTSALHDVLLGSWGL